VNQAIGGAQVDEGAVRGQAGNLAADVVADLEPVEELRPLPRPILIKGCASG